VKIPSDDEALKCGDHKRPGCPICRGFANTGEEHEKTLVFVDKCDKHFKLGLTWVEAVIHPGRVGTTHRIVTFETASRNGEPYKAMTAKFGIANKNFPHCTRELKLRPMYSYLKSIGWKTGTYWIALGIRGDEPDRLPKQKTGETPQEFRSRVKRKRIFYPLALAGWSKADVLEFWKTMPFDLGIEEREGNCKWCFKKSERKLCQNVATNPEWFKTPAELERRYSHIRIQDDTKPEPRFIFRGGRSTGELMASVPKDMIVNPEQVRACTDDGCSESCEVPFAEEEAS
jgi:hypothetical protein